jgi:hypothetical protein
MPHDIFMRLDDSGNYLNWKIFMEAHLISKKLFDYVDGSHPRPMGSANHKPVVAFEKKSRLAYAEIIKHLDPSQYPHATSRDPVLIWRTLEQIHMARGFGSRQALMRQFVNTRYVEDQSIEKWISDIRQQSNVLLSLGADITDQWIILVLTNGLPNRYHSFVQSLDAVAPELLTLDYVISRIINAAAIHHVEGPPNDDEPVAMAARFKDYKARSQGSRALNKLVDSQIRCHRCQGFGHLKINCPSIAVGEAKSATQDVDSEEADDWAL